MARTLLILLVLSGCSSAQRRKTETKIADVLVSDEQENELGFQLHEQLKKDNVKFLENEKVGIYVERLTNKLIAEANKERPQEWHVYVIDDPKTVNAFATPGGRIYIFTGLLLAADNEAEVVGVLGHELGHVVAHHTGRQLVAANGLQAISALALGQNAGLAAKLSAALVGQGAQLAYGRDMELEADQFGARYASGAGYDPHALATFFQKLLAQKADPNKILVLLSTHPANADRIARIDKYISEKGLQGSELGATSLQAVKAELGSNAP